MLETHEQMVAFDETDPTRKQSTYESKSVPNFYAHALYRGVM